MCAKLFYEVTPPSKRSTRWELVNTVEAALVAGASGVDITDSPTGESHSSSVAASVFVKLTYGAPVICHIRTRDVTRMGLRSLVRACAVWDVDSILFVMGEGLESTGLTPTGAINLIRSEGLVNGTDVKLGLVVDPRRTTSLERKIAANPDFIYSAPLVSQADVGFIREVSSKIGSEVYAGLIVNSTPNKQILSRIGVSQTFEGLVDWGLIDTLKAIASVLILMSPADPDSGISVLKEVKTRGI
ncbi:MAG: hypothetical protein QW514_03685 [Thermoprotei archaeon]